MATASIIFKRPRAGTNPFDPRSFPRLTIQPAGTDLLALSWESAAGKVYDLEGTDDLAAVQWDMLGTFSGNGSPLGTTMLTPGIPWYYFRVSIGDKDSDLAANGTPAPDGVSDWEELVLGFNPTTARTDRYDQTDLQRITAGLSSPSVITVAALDPEMSERWPDHGLVAVRRSGGGLAPLTVNFQLGGTASNNVDYSVVGGGDGNSVMIPAGCSRSVGRVRAHC